MGAHALYCGLVSCLAASRSGQVLYLRDSGTGLLRARSRKSRAQAKERATDIARQVLGSGSAGIMLPYRVRTSRPCPCEIPALLLGFVPSRVCDDPSRVPCGRVLSIRDCKQRCTPPPPPPSQRSHPLPAGWHALPQQNPRCVTWAPCQL